MKNIVYDAITKETTIIDVPDIEIPEMSQTESETIINDVKTLVEGISTDFMDFMDWYFEIHPDEA
jgi:hypothetical protein